jgi:hypothetical protein
VFLEHPIASTARLSPTESQRIMFSSSRAPDYSLTTR